MNKTSKILIGVLSVVAIAGVAFGLGGKGLQGKIALNDLPFSIKVTSSQAETVMNGTKNAGVGTWYISAKKEIQIKLGRFTSSFLVQNVFEIKGHGKVFAGKVLRGKIKIDQNVYFSGSWGKIDWIEALQKPLMGSTFVEGN
jgi:hypothetical protein